ncbi:MAG TPA: hypothetical protein VJN43_13105 [Bryobacteraceae bacterium]|nr:hypothetical protein [Bryobacteraceae bacterium]
MIESLDVALARWQHVRLVGEWILVIGIAGELLVAVAGLVRHLRIRLEKLAAIAFTALILFGLGIENIGGNRAGDVVRRMRTPRSLNENQKKRVATKISKFRGQGYEIRKSGTTAEQSGLLIDISVVLDLHAHWQLLSSPTAWSDSTARGVIIEPTREPQSIRAAQELSDALNAEGILAFNIGGSRDISSPPAFLPDCEGAKEHRLPQVYCSRVSILVGDHP